MSEIPLSVDRGVGRSRGPREPRVLKRDATGGGPRQGVLALGYAGWGPGQLESEIQRNAWLSVSPDEGLLFREAADRMWRQAMAKLKVDPLLLSGAAGHA